MRFLASLLLVALTALVTVGCGSDDDFVATGGFTPAPAATTGDLTFKTFVLAPQAVVPNQTTDLDFEFFDSANNSVFTASRPFAAEVTVTDVPVTATRVVITARGPNGPLAVIEANVTVVGGQVTVVDLSGATVTLLGQLIVEPATLQFAPGGLIGLIDDFLTLVQDGDIQNVALFRAYFIPAGETERVEVTARVGVHFDNFFPNTLTPDSFAHLNLLGEGIAITANPLGPTPPFGAKADMVVTFIQNGQVYTDRVEILLESPELVGIEVRDLVIPGTGSTAPVVAQAVYSNGVKLPIVFDGANMGTAGGFGVGDTFTLAVQTANPDVNLQPMGVVTTTAGTTGSAVLGISANGGTPETFNVTMVDGQVSEVALSVARTDIDPIGTYQVTVTYNDPAATTTDFTHLWSAGAFTSVPGTPPGAVGFGILDILFNGGTPGGRLLGVVKGEVTLRLDDGTPAGVTGVLTTAPLNIPGADTNPGNNTVDLNVLSTVPLSLIGSLVP